MEFMPQHAPAVILSFLFTGFLLLLAALSFVYAGTVGKRDRAKKVLLATCGVVGTYSAILLMVSLESSERVLAVGQRKYFCEVDCHLAYSVVDVKTAKTLGSAPNQTTAAGTYYIVTVKTFFDERTISNRRSKDIPLIPDPRMVIVVDDRGRKFETSLEGQKALEIASNVPLTQALRPGQFYTTALVFDLPADTAKPRLLITDLDPITCLLIGHENSFLHKKILFSLEQSA